MSKFAGLLVCILVVATSAERISPSSSRGSSDFNFDADSDLSSPKIVAWRSGVIPYEISTDIARSDATALKKMFQTITANSCVRFVEKRSSDSNYASFQTGNRCSAPLGMTGSSSTSSRFSSAVAANVVLGRSCFTEKRVGRRIMNLLGIPHETSRPDRDQFVEINFKNLRTGYDKNLKQFQSSAYLPGVLALPYDVKSVTQYSDDDLAKDKNTWAIRPTRKVRSGTDLGGNTFSPLDFAKIRAAYNCPSPSDFKIRSAIL